MSNAIIRHFFNRELGLPYSTGSPCNRTPPPPVCVEVSSRSPLQRLSQESQGTSFLQQLLLQRGLYTLSAR